MGSTWLLAWPLLLMLAITAAGAVWGVVLLLVGLVRLWRAERWRQT